MNVTSGTLPFSINNLGRPFLPNMQAGTGKAVFWDAFKGELVHAD
jgi:hypothetical protein